MIPYVRCIQLKYLNGRDLRTFQNTENRDLKSKKGPKIGTLLGTVVTETLYVCLCVCVCTFCLCFSVSMRFCVSVLTEPVQVSVYEAGLGV